jgi:hypothetical protein
MINRILKNEIEVSLELKRNEDILHILRWNHFLSIHQNINVEFKPKKHVILKGIIS